MPTTPTRLLAAAATIALATTTLGFSPATGVTDAPSDATAQQQRVVPAGYELTDHWYESHDGVKLHAGVYLPADRTDDEVHPVILSVTPYTSPNGGALGLGFTNSEIPLRFPELFEHPRFTEGRYAYIAADVRGFGGSGGCFQYYGNDEYLDMDTHVEWAANQDWSNGNVGLWGKSYDAAQEVLALGDPTPGLKAAVIQAPGLSGYTALWQNGLHYATGRYATTSVYVADDLFPNQSMGSLTSTDNTLAQVDGVEGRPECTVDWQGMNLIGDRDSDYWADKEPYRNVVDNGSDVPVLWHNGFWDANTKPVGLDVVQSLTGDLEVIWGQWDHKRGNETQFIGRDGFLDQSFRFFDEHLLGLDVDEDPKAIIQSGGPDGHWRAEAEWPPLDVAPWTFDLNDGSFQDLPELLVGGPDSGDGVWSTTPVLPHDVHIAGEPRLHGTIATNLPGQSLVARMYDIAPDGTAYLISRVGYAATTSFPVSGQPEALDVKMNPNDWVVQAGHRIGVYLAASEDNWFTPGATGQTTLVDLDVDLPLITAKRTEFLDGGESNFSRPFRETLDSSLVEAHEVAGAIPPAQTTD